MELTSFDLYFDLFRCTFGSVSSADIFKLAYEVTKSSDCCHLFGYRTFGFDFTLGFLSPVEFGRIRIFLRFLHSWQISTLEMDPLLLQSMAFNDVEQIS